MIYNQCRNTHVSTIATVLSKTINTEKFRLKIYVRLVKPVLLQAHLSKNKHNGLMRGGRPSINKLQVLI
jgi:hypothetical protein